MPGRRTFRVGRRSFVTRTERKLGPPKIDACGFEPSWILVKEPHSAVTATAQEASHAAGRMIVIDMEPVSLLLAADRTTAPLREHQGFEVIQGCPVLAAEVLVAVPSAFVRTSGFAAPPL